MTIYTCTPEPDEQITTVWSKDQETGKWISWSRHERRWLESAGGHFYSWTELLHRGPVTDIDPELSALTLMIQTSGRHDEASAYKLALFIRNQGWRRVEPAEPC